ncbi:hypothetical protein [Streptomyces katrae]|uniref:hypothetical protein n=1 Tax=Streptomyces katrae TaxID=68223 RepID=UPI0004C09E60|nr:hypothetical protein [Streptomyces katrae]
MVFRGRIDHNNNLVNVTRRPRYVTLWWSMEPGGNNCEIEAVISPLDADGNVAPPVESADRYGLVKEESRVARVAVGPLAAR